MAAAADSVVAAVVEAPVLTLSRDALEALSLSAWRKKIYDTLSCEARAGLFEAFFEFKESKALDSSKNAVMWSKYFYELFEVAESHGLTVYQRRDPYQDYQRVTSKESFQYWGPTTTLCVTWV